MRSAVIVSTARTGIGKAGRGSLNLTHGATMGGRVAAVAVDVGEAVSRRERRTPPAVVHVEKEGAYEPSQPSCPTRRPWPERARP